MQITTRLGDPDLYVYVAPRNSSVPRNETYAPVSFSNAMWGSINSTGNELVAISQSDPRFIAACGTRTLPPVPCVIYAGVFGWDTPSVYSISLSSTSRQLSVGFPMPGFTFSNQYVYFSFTARSFESFTIALTSVSGDADMYMTMNASAPTPTAAHYDWASTSTGSDSIYINFQTDPRLADASVPLEFFIGVVG